MDTTLTLATPTVGEDETFAWSGTPYRAVWRGPLVEAEGLPGGRAVKRRELWIYAPEIPAIRGGVLPAGVFFAGLQPFKASWEGRESYPHRAMDIMAQLLGRTIDWELISHGRGSAYARSAYASGWDEFARDALWGSDIQKLEADMKAQTLQYKPAPAASGKPRAKPSLAAINKDLRGKGIVVKQKGRVFQVLYAADVRSLPAAKLAAKAYRTEDAQDALETGRRMASQAAEAKKRAKAKRGK